MVQGTKIAWATDTFNGWIGCTKVSPGCEHCYAEARDKRLNEGRWGKGAPRVMTGVKNWNQVLKWDREAKETGEQRRVFCSSLADVFDAEVPDDWRDQLFALIGMTPNLRWLVLTKRERDMLRYYSLVQGDRMRIYKAGFKRFGFLAEPLKKWAEENPEGRFEMGEDCTISKDDHLEVPFTNIWQGVTVEDQDRAYRLEALRRLHASVLWVSIEPQIGFVNIFGLLGQDHHFLNWIVVGGESGKDARPFNLDWAKHMHGQCQVAGAAFFMKQYGEHWGDGETKLHRTPGNKWDNPEEWRHDLRVREFPKELAF